MKANDQNSLPPFCLACDWEGRPEQVWSKKRSNVEQLFRGETFFVEMECFACKRCGFKLAQEREAEELVRKTRELYREKHGLLAPEEIVARRKKLGLNQKQFAARLQVGLASIKRWETGAVQDKSSDLLIRKSTESEEAAEASCREAIFDLISGTPIKAEAMKFIEELEQRTERRDASHAPSIARAIKFMAGALKPRKETNSRGSFSVKRNRAGDWVEQRKKLPSGSQTTPSFYAFPDSA